MYVQCPSIGESNEFEPNRLARSRNGNIRTPHWPSHSNTRNSEQMELIQMESKKLKHGTVSLEAMLWMLVHEIELTIMSRRVVIENTITDWTICTKMIELKSRWYSMTNLKSEWNH